MTKQKKGKFKKNIMQWILIKLGILEDTDVASL